MSWWLDTLCIDSDAQGVEQVTVKYITLKNA